RQIHEQRALSGALQIGGIQTAIVVLALDEAVANFDHDRGCVVATLAGGMRDQVLGRVRRGASAQQLGQLALVFDLRVDAVTTDEQAVPRLTSTNSMSTVTTSLMPSALVMPEPCAGATERPKPSTLNTAWPV